ncbi:MAG: alpha/beta hydrolase [Acidimicrobiales bacterium]|nr:alpha/beta hydrolase [Acidimicrobiales bacterium]
MPSADVNEITIEFLDEGAGDPLLLVMGWGAQLIDWPEGLVEMFIENGFRVIRFDNRDAGLSTEFDWEPPSLFQTFVKGTLQRGIPVHYTLSDMARDGIALLDHLEIESAHVVGVSMGGMIAQTMAIEHPERVRTLTSIMSNTGDRRNGRIAAKLVPKMLTHKPNREDAPHEGARLLSHFAGPHYNFDDALERGRARADRSWRPEGSARQIAAIGASPDRTADLKKLNVPTLVIHGLLDTLVLPTGGIATAKAIPGAQLLMFPDMGHDLPEPRWADMVSAIRMLADRTDHATLHAEAS